MSLPKMQTCIELLKNLGVRATSYIKAAVIQLTDILNWLHDPFEEFTRPLQTKYDELLCVKAAKFEQQLMDHFQLFNGDILQYYIRLNSIYVDTGDQSLWHGIYTAMLAIKYSVTRDAVTSLDISKCIRGLEMQQPNGNLRRGIQVDSSFQDDTSNDQLSGHLAGLYFVWKYGSEDHKAAVKPLIQTLADQLLDHGMNMINDNGTVTTYGALDQGWKADPLRVTLAMAVMKLAEAAVGLPTYTQAYIRLLLRHGPMVKYPKVYLWWIGQDYDTHRAAIHLSILADLEKDYATHHLYVEGLVRIWKIARKTANPWIYYLVRRHVLVDPGDIPNCLKHLKEMTVEDKYEVVEKINSTDKGIKTVSWGNHQLTTQPLPRWRAGSQDFFWQRSFYHLDDWQGVTTASEAYNGADFLIAYWGFRSLNLITGAE